MHDSGIRSRESKRKFPDAFQGVLQDTKLFCAAERFVLYFLCRFFAVFSRFYGVFSGSWQIFILRPLKMAEVHFALSESIASGSFVWSKASESSVWGQDFWKLCLGLRLLEALSKSNASESFVWDQGFWKLCLRARLIALSQTKHSEAFFGPRRENS